MILHKRGLDPLLKINSLGSAREEAPLAVQPLKLNYQFEEKINIIIENQEYYLRCEQKVHTNNMVKLDQAYVWYLVSLPINHKQRN